jgi:hypothetical protein
MQIGKGTELRAPIWHSSMQEAFFIHVRSAPEAIKRKGYFKTYTESNEVFEEQHGVLSVLLGKGDKNRRVVLPK